MLYVYIPFLKRFACHLSFFLLLAYSLTFSCINVFVFHQYMYALYSFFDVLVGVIPFIQNNTLPLLLDLCCRAATHCSCICLNFYMFIFSTGGARGASPRRNQSFRSPRSSTEVQKSARLVL